MRRIVAVLCLLFAASWAEAAPTPARVCRKACGPIAPSVCPAKGRAFRVCRTRLVRACRRQGVAVCALGLPTGGPGGTDQTTTTTFPVATTTTTTPRPGATTTTDPGGGPTTTTLPAPTVGGAWSFVGQATQPGCGLDESFAAIVADLVVRQTGAILDGTVDGAAATGVVAMDGWTFASVPDCRPLGGGSVSCCLSFAVTSGDVVSPAPAEGVATASCDDGSSCTARWAGSVTRVP